MASRSLPEAKLILEIISLQGLHRLSDPSRGAGYLANLKSRKTISQGSSPSSLLFEDGGPLLQDNDAERHVLQPLVH
jgi:hypothetical protein